MNPVTGGYGDGWSIGQGRRGEYCPFARLYNIETIHTHANANTPEHNTHSQTQTF